MAAPKIKKKATSAKTSAIPRQGVIPCLVLIAIGLVILAVFFFLGFHVTG